MNRTSLLLPSILIAILVSGCIGTDSNDFSSEDRLVGKPFNGGDRGSGHLEESESELIFTLDLGEDLHIIILEVIINWEDEPPVERGIDYRNEGDLFRVKISDGGDINIVRSLVNQEESIGRLYAYIPGDVVDNQTSSDPKTFIVEVTLTNAGDHYPYRYHSESMRVDDTGNDYSWIVEYTYVDKNS